MQSLFCFNLKFSNIFLMKRFEFSIEEDLESCDKTLIC